MKLGFSSIGLIILQLLVFGSSGVSTAQNPPAPPPPVAKSTPPPKTELTEAEFAAKIVESLSKPQAWRPHEFPGFDIKVDLPRDPVRQTESFYDEALGNAKANVHVAVGDNATYVVGNVRIPYALTDEKLVREAYQEAIKEFAQDPELKFGNPKDFYFDGKLGVEVVSVPSDARYLPARLRVFILGRTIYLLMAMPSLVPGEGDPPSKKLKDKVNAEFDSFFASAKPVSRKSPVDAAPEDAMIRGSFSNRLYKSEYFGFSFTVPEGWSRVESDDVDGIRKWGLDYIAQNTGRPIPAPPAKRNFAAFVSKPLGNERVAMLSINLGLPAVKPDSAMQMAKLTESLLAKVQTYKLRKSASRTKLGGAPAVTIEGTLAVLNEAQNQVIYLIEQKGYVIAFTLNYYDEADRQKGEAALQTLKFTAK